jgi:hypothetical protein
MSSSSKSTRPFFLQNRWLRRGLAAVAFLGLLLLFPPFVLKYYAVRWLQDNGADKAEIHSLWLNPFLGKLQLKGVNVEVGGVSLLHDGTMDIDLSLGSLFRKEVRLEKAEYHDLSLVVEQLAGGGYRLASYTLQQTGELSADTNVESPEDVANAWAFLADRVTLSNCRLQFKSPDLDLTLAIDQAELIRLSTRAEQQAGTFRLQGRINDKPVTLKLDKLMLAPELTIAGNVAAEGFDLADLSRLLHDALPTFAGTFGIGGDLRYQRKQDGTQLVGWDGTLAVKAPTVGNPAFTAAASAISYEGKAEVSIPAGAPLAIGVDGALQAASFQLQLPDAAVTTGEENILLKGKTKVTIGDDIQVTHVGALQLDKTTVRVGEQQIANQSLFLQGETRVTVAHDTQVAQNGKLQLGQTTVTIGEQQMANQLFSWQGQTQYHSNLAGHGNGVQVDGTLEMTGLQYDGNGLESGNGAVKWQGQIGFQENPQAVATVTLKGDLGTTGSTLAVAQSLVGLGTSDLQADLTLILADEPGISGTAGLTVGELQVAVDSEEPLRLDIGTVDIVGVQAAGAKKIGVDQLRIGGITTTIQGSLPLTLQVDHTELTKLASDNWLAWRVGSLAVNNVDALSLKTGGELFRLSQAQIGDLRMDEKMAVAIGETTLREVRLLGGDEKVNSPLSLQTLAFKDIRFDTKDGLICDSAQLENLAVDLTRVQGGQFEVANQLAAMMESADMEKKSSEPDSRGADQPGAAGFPVGLGMLTAAGKNIVRFHDLTLAQPFSTTLAFDKLSFGPVDSLRPEEKSNLLLNGTLEGRAPLQLTGTVAPFLPKPAIDLQLKLKNYPLANLSSYTIDSVGTGLASGQLQLETTFGLADDRLDMENKLLLKKLQTKTVSPELAKDLDNQLPMPLDAALAVLRDSENNISLNIPLSGALSDLDVGLTDVIITALGKAIIPAASGYLVYALGPYGALAYVGMKVGEKMLQIRLPPVQFPVGSAELDGIHDDYLQRVGKILTDRPKTDLQICPQVGAWELFDEQGQKQYRAAPVPPEPKLVDQLRQLGEERGDAIKRYMTERFGIDSGRLLICDTTVVENPQQEPKVLLQL